MFWLLLYVLAICILALLVGRIMAHCDTAPSPETHGVY